MIVADTNLIAYFITATAAGYEKLADAVYQKDPRRCAPFVWRSQYANILSTYVRTRQLGVADARRAMRQAAALLHDNEYAPDYDRVLELAAKSGATAYDTEFVELAERLGVVLVTNDAALRRVFPKLAVSMGEFVGLHIPLVSDPHSEMLRTGVPICFGPPFRFDSDPLLT